MCGQPLTMDPSRAPDGAGLLWIQLQELPWQIKGDAAGELDTGDGTWTEELREALRRPDPGAAREAHHEPRLGCPRRAPRSRRPTSRPRTQTSNRATRMPARSGSTRTSSGGRFPGSQGTERRSRRSGRSARAPGRARGSAPDRERSSPPSCFARARPTASRGDSAGERAAPLDLRDLDAARVVRGGPRRLRRGRARRDRDLGAEARRPGRGRPFAASSSSGAASARRAPFRPSPRSFPCRSSAAPPTRPSGSRRCSPRSRASRPSAQRESCA